MNNVFGINAISNKIVLDFLKLGRQPTAYVNLIKQGLSEPAKVGAFQLKDPYDFEQLLFTDKYEHNFCSYKQLNELLKQKGLKIEYAGNKYKIASVEPKKQTVKVLK